MKRLFYVALGSSLVFVACGNCRVPISSSSSPKGKSSSFVVKSCNSLRMSSASLSSSRSHVNPISSLSVLGHCGIFVLIL